MQIARHAAFEHFSRECLGNRCQWVSLLDIGLARRDMHQRITEIMMEMVLDSKRTFHRLTRGAAHLERDVGVITRTSIPGKELVPNRRIGVPPRG
jgi:hypothetical protein